MLRLSKKADYALLAMRHLAAGADREAVSARELAEAYDIPAARVKSRAEIIPMVEKARGSGGPMLIEFQVEKEDSVYPMVPAGADLHNMIRRPSEEVRA